LSLKTIFQFFLLTILIPLLIVELVVRSYFSFIVGPSVLLYGTRLHHKDISGDLNRSGYNEITGPEAKTYLNTMSKSEWQAKRTVVTHTNEVSGYSKYFPRQIRFDFDVETGERFFVTINDDGFRGLDIVEHKAPNTIRIVTLGASSTFGYFNRDNETYPVYLENILNEQGPGKLQFEVINLGIPHLRTAQIYQLFINEAIRLDPDIVTFYEGNNDAESMPMVGSRPVSMFSLALKNAGEYLITLGLIDSILDSHRKIQYSTADIIKRAAASDEFINNIANIYQECRNRGITFIVGNQQKNSQLLERGQLKGLTYDEEVQKVQAMVSRLGNLGTREYVFLAHAFLMENLQTWAKANGIPFVDIIRRLDNDRDVLVSWVHLSPKGNRMVAEAFAEEILKYLPRTSDESMSQKSSFLADRIGIQN